MFKAFYLDVAKVDLGVAYMHVTRVRFNCFRCFIRMLQVFYLDVAYVLRWILGVLQVF